jgi:hypothetical protein
MSQRQIAEEMGLPRSTLEYWLSRKQSIDAEPELVEFFESEVGIAFLHRLIIASHFAITLIGPSGTRVVCQFLESAGLDQFVASSYGSQQAVSVAMEEAIVSYGEAEHASLSATMSSKEITVCEDETFHPEICLVAMEPVSNYILLEAYASDRKAETWTQALSESLTGMPVKVVQGASDEGLGLRRHIEKDLGVHHSSDLFHVQQSASKATSAPLAAQVRQVEKAVEKAQKELEGVRSAQETYLNQEPRPVGRPPDYDQRFTKAQTQVESTEQLVETVLARQTQAQEAVLGISHSYHPFDLKTGAAQEPEAVAQALETHFNTLETVAVEAQLPERSFKNICKAKRLTTKMVATIAFFFLTIRAKVDALCLTPDQEQAMHQRLIPAIYLRLAADKAASAQQRKELHQSSQALLDRVNATDSPLAFLKESEKQLIESVATECAQLFQRSSSCIEGRNGQLALRHHGLHRISHRKLSALTVVHNFYITRPDDSTAAQRFFQRSHRNLFDYLLTQVDLPGRPAKKRPPSPKTSCLI